MQTFIIRRRSVWATESEWQRSAERSRRVCREQMTDKLRWMRSYLVREDDGSLGSVCLCRAANANAVREHALRSGIPADEIKPLVRASQGADPTRGIRGQAA